MMFIAESFFSGCISKVINDGKDYSWIKIKSVINDRNDRNLSTRIYRVIEKALIKVIDKKFKGMDILYEAIEKIFIEFRNHGSIIESVKCGLGMLNSNVTVERCENFLEKFYEGICQDGDLHKVIGLILQEKGIDINRKEFWQLNKTVEYGFDKLNRKTPFSEKCSHSSFSKFWCIFIHFLIFRAIWTTVFKIFPTEYWKNLGWELEKGYPFDWVAFSIFSYTLYLIVYYHC